MTDKFAFVCSNCGTLETSENAGERHLPGACRVCGAGVTFDPKTGAKVFDDSNWTVLTEAPEDHPVWDRITPKQIEKHMPAAPTADREPQLIERTAEDTLGTEDHA